MTLAWLAFVWSRPAFPAEPAGQPAPSPSAQVSDDSGIDSQPVAAETFLGAGTAPPADQPAPTLRLAPISIGYGGSLGYDIEQSNSRGGETQLRQKLILDMQGKAGTYIWQPWIAQVNSNLGFTATKSLSNDIGSSHNRISGGAALGLVPYSRYPFKAGITRNQNYTGPGIGTPVAQTTRLDMEQRYTPMHRKESYRVGYIRSQSDSGEYESARQTESSFSMASGRFKQQSIEAEASRARDMRLSGGTSLLSNQTSDTQSSRAAVKHRYRAIGGLSIENNASLVSTSEQGLLESTDFRIRELNSTLTLQPIAAPYSVVGSARVHAADFDRQAVSSHTRVANANLGVNYRPTKYITLSASGNVNVSNGVRTYSLTATQTATANYPLASTDLDGWRYTPALSGSLSNSTTNRDGLSGSVQTATISPSHGLIRSMDFSGGKLDLNLNQALTVSESTRSQAVSRLIHSAAANWRRRQGKGDTSVRLSGRDSRSLTRTQDVFQNIDLSANFNEEFSRDSTLVGSLIAQVARQVNPDTLSTNVSTGSSALLRYSHQRAFGVPRLIFNSEVRTHSRALIPVLAANPDEQGPITWENSLQYHVGRLDAKFRVNLSKSGDGTTRSLIALSLKRYF